jgi:prepilin-type N-terminal cleavage/methylation domain-containing protein
MRFVGRTSAGVTPGARRAGFTLIEIMVVVAIMAIVLGMGVPLVYQLGHKEPMRKATADLVELFSNARAQAILQNTRTEVVFRPHEGIATLGGGSAPAPRQPQRGDEMPAESPVPANPAPGSKTAVQMPEGVAIVMLAIDQMDRMDQETVSVRFYANGTCDEMFMIYEGNGQQRGITLEVTTGLASTLNEQELQEWRNRAQ